MFGRSIQPGLKYISLLHNKMKIRSEHFIKNHKNALLNSKGSCIVSFITSLHDLFISLACTDSMGPLSTFRIILVSIHGPTKYSTLQYTVQLKFHLRNAYAVNTSLRYNITGKTPCGTQKKITSMLYFIST